jgi:predicted RNA binding protein YcfA (HicA-like mRNA interferase family)
VRMAFAVDVYFVCIVYFEVRMSSREVIRELLKNGWFEVAQVGSHKQFRHASKAGRVTVPYPKRDIPLGTLKSIEKQAGIKLS